MLTAGDEFGRTQGGNNNAYAQDNATTWLDWASADRDLADFTAQLAALRRQHPALRSPDFLTGAAACDGLADVTWLGPAGGEMRAERLGRRAQALGVVLHAEGDRVAFWINGGSDEITAHLPAARRGFAWKRALASRAPDEDGDDDLRLAPRSVTIWVETRS